MARNYVPPCPHRPIGNKPTGGQTHNLAMQGERLAAHRRVGLAAKGQGGLSANAGAHAFPHSFGIADCVKSNAIHSGLDEPLEEGGCVAITAAARIVGIVGDDKRLITRLPATGEHHRFSNRQ